VRLRPLLIAGALVFAGLTVVPSSASAACPWVGSTASAASKAGQVVGRMTLAEKVQLVTGAANNGPSAGVVNGIPRLCIPRLVLNDASAGLGNRQTGTTAFPDEIAQTATWDTALQTAQGRALGAEAVAKGVNVLFGPGANLARNPLNGRGFEYAGEDPVLAGRTAAALVKGIQSQHVIATVKHLTLNDQETNRTTVSSDADERVVNELYLRPFEDAVNAGVGAAMCAYNRVSAVYACESGSLLQSVLKDRLRFPGFVVSDFMATHSTGAANKGLDMEMPTGKYYGAALLRAVQSGSVPTATLNGMVKRVLTSMFAVGLVDHPPRKPVATATTPGSVGVATRVAQDGSVLLKNSGVLPLDGKSQRIAVIGDAADGDGAQRASQGYGSAHVPQFGYHPRVYSPLDAITARAKQSGATVSYQDGSSLPQALLAAALADVAVVFVNDVSIEGSDRPDLTAHNGTCSLTGGTTCTYSSLDQDQLVKSVAAVNKNTVVVLQTGGPVEMPWLSSVAAVVENWLPGQVDGASIAPLLYGDVNFSGKLPVTFPVALADGPLKTAAQYPGVTDARGVPHARYSEGLLMGYRWYDAKKVTPLFPFGFGLSYTTFRYSKVRLVGTSTGVNAQVTVQNTGSRAGAEVVQVYAVPPSGTGEPPKSLVGFTKVVLKPGQTATVTVPVPNRAFSVWSASRHAWTPVAGCWVIRAGGSSRALPLASGLSRGGKVC
jgi:beta-glucosidase